MMSSSILGFFPVGCANGIYISPVTHRTRGNSSTRMQGCLSYWGGAAGENADLLDITSHWRLYPVFNVARLKLSTVIDRTGEHLPPPPQLRSTATPSSGYEVETLGSRWRIHGEAATSCYASATSRRALGHTSGCWKSDCRWKRWQLCLETVFFLEDIASAPQRGVTVRGGSRVCEQVTGGATGSFHKRVPHCSENRFSIPPRSLPDRPSFQSVVVPR